MSDKLYKMSLTRLLNWALADEKEGKIFEVYKKQFFTPNKSNPFRMQRYGQLLETPVGVAAGPHTQLAQNIVTAWLTGSRYIELKTVQTLDELEVAKPCIEMEDEGYNCEWSQELKIKDSFDEYLNAWILIHILKDKFGWNDYEELGTIFNISVGYDLKGILKPNVQWFLDKMTDCGDELKNKIESIIPLYPKAADIQIPLQISDNVTLSTMHGCPPDEIESIAKYLMEKKRLHTTVKLNPTLLGPEQLRSILNNKLGFETFVPDIAFEHDLKFEDAKRIIKNLLTVAKKSNVEFGLKLTNTLESKNRTDELPATEDMVYMSGRALHPISINLAAKLQNEFNGNLDISFSAGVDAFNIAQVIKCNLKPVTVCSDLLKPGGYTRTLQYLENLESEIKNTNAKNLHEFILNSSSQNDLISASLQNLNEYAEFVLNDKRYKKEFFKYDNIKTERKLTTYDCVHAPCIEECAISQDIPNYMYYTANGEFDKAFDVIAKTNPLPNITGMVCDHLCQSKCTRINYDNPLLIREIKRFVSEKESGNFSLKSAEPQNISAAVIGAGPAGLSAAYFLALQGIQVHVYESKSFAGGMASDAIPVFRITEEAIAKDVENIKSLGVKFHFNAKIDKIKFSEIKNSFNFVFISVGAQKGKRLNIKGENSKGVFDQITFLSDVLKNKPLQLGKSVAIIGGGLSAVDAARTSKRLVGKSGEITVVYRRTKKEMPCGWEEIEIMEEEGINILELTSPVEIIDNRNSLDLKCIKMQLSELDESGRRKPVPIASSDFNLHFDSIITAIGQDLDISFFNEDKIKVDEITKETQTKNIFAGGDAIRGADSLINAIADGKIVAEEIIKRSESEFDFYQLKVNKGLEAADFQYKLARREYGHPIPTIPVEERISFDLVHPLLDDDEGKNEAARCLFCNDVCNICVSVCPNISNLAVTFIQEDLKYPIINILGDSFETIETKTFRISQAPQIINIGDFCNECGNCTTFCPTSGDPYKTKPKFYLTKESFDKEDNCYFISKDEVFYKSNGKTVLLKHVENTVVFETDKIKAVFDAEKFIILSLENKSSANSTIDFSKAVEMHVLLNNLSGNSIFEN